MGILGKIFTWWDGATIGTSLFTARKGQKVGEDIQGNVYYEGGSDVHGGGGDLDVQEDGARLLHASWGNAWAVKV